MWTRLGVWLWACQRYSHQDPVRLWQLSAGKHRAMRPAPAWYVEEGKRYSLPQSPDGG